MTSIPEPAQRPANDSTQAAVTTRGRVAPKRAKQANAIAGGKRRPRSAIRPGTKTAKILRLLKRPGGASLAELTKATGWQAHSVRGFLSGAVKAKMRLKVISAKREDGERAYRVPA
ncbi:MAG: DUF3489 domain-containing protein [Bryobacteraceae bacterium]|jgi:hypothetical protein